MVGTLDLIRRMHGHRTWANAKLREAAAGLSDEQLHRAFEIGQGSVWATLVHLYGAERVWLSAMLDNESNPTLAGPADFSGLDELFAAWDVLNERWAGFLKDLNPRRVGQYKVEKVAPDGRTYSTPTSDVLLHVCLHANYTAAQGVNMLRRLGVAVPDVSLISMSRSGA